jgi:hypothetical protein
MALGQRTEMPVLKRGFIAGELGVIAELLGGLGLTIV